MKPLKFIHITKCAGTTMENITLKHNFHGNYVKWGKNDSSELCGSFGKSIRQQYKAWWHIPLRYSKPKRLDYLLEHYRFFTIVRNPYDRVISEYYCPWGGPEEKSQDIEEFNQYIIDRLINIHKYIKYNMPLCGHWAPQYYYFFDNHGQVVISHALKMENLSTEFNSLMKKYHYPFRLNSDSHKYNESKKYFSKKDLFPRTRQLIQQIYGKDFELLGYSKNV